MSERSDRGGGEESPLEPAAVQARSNTGVDGSWFGPGTPLQPTAPPTVAGRQFDFPSGYNINVRPRAYEAFGFGQLRMFAEAYDVLRTVIETRKDQMARHEWRLKPKGTDDKALALKLSGKIDACTKFLRKPDKINTWSTWLRLLLEDLFVLDAPTLYIRRTMVGRFYSLEPVDGATVKLIIDQNGRTPLPPDPAYQQVLKGLPAVDYSIAEMIYRPRNPRTHKVYGFSPVEQIVMTVNIALRRQLFQLSYYTEGNVPEALIGVPDSWTPDQIKQFQGFWDTMMEGNLAQRRHAKFVPGGVAKTYIPTKEPELTGAMDEWLTRVVCFAFSISPLPFIKMLNRSTSETSQDTAIEEGQQPIQQWVKELIDGILEDPDLLDAGELEFEWVVSKQLDPEKAAKQRVEDAKAGIRKINECRAEMDLPPEPGAANELLVYTTAGYVPVNQKPKPDPVPEAVPAPTDADTADADS